MFCLFSHDSCLLLSKHRINWLHVITISEERLTRQQHKSDVKQKGVYDRGRRDAACYLFTIIKMESCESRRAILLPSSSVCTAMKCYMSAGAGRVCILSMYSYRQRGFSELTSRPLVPRYSSLASLLLISALDDKTSLLKRMYSLDRRISRRTSNL